MDSSLKEKWMKKRAVGERNRISRTQWRAYVESSINYPQGGISHDRFDNAEVTDISKTWLKTTPPISCNAPEPLCVGWGPLLCVIQTGDRVWQHSCCLEICGSSDRGKRGPWRASISSQKPYVPSVHSWLARTSHMMPFDTKSSKKSLLPKFLVGGELWIFWWMKLILITKGKTNEQKTQNLQRTFHMYSFILA